MSPPEEPPDAGLPEGISLETTSGVSVLRVSFDGDDERARRDVEEQARMAEERNERAVTTVLRHPETNVPVEIIGTAHVSALAARQTRELILRTKPDVVVLELDPQRLASMLRDAQLRTPARHLAETNVETHLDAAVLVPGAGIQVIGDWRTLRRAVLGPAGRGVPRRDRRREGDGRRGGAGDLDAKPRPRACSRGQVARGAEESRRAREASRDEHARRRRSRICHKRICPNPSEPAARAGFRDVPRRLGEAGAGADARRASIDARRRMRRGAARGGRVALVMHADPDPADLLAVRECAAKVVELVRSEAYLEKNGSFDGDRATLALRIAGGKDGTSSAKDGFAKSLLLLRPPTLAGGRWTRPCVSTATWS